jgi:TetR/AcrR family transcriptional regulator, regulator of cefoperazone and chloramphenicol sensitivity
MGTPKDSEKTRTKLIEAAGQLFAERGFNGVTVRDIAKRSETHLSALNYHFRSKEALYREAILEACKTDSITPKERKQLQKLDPDKALHILVKEAIKQYADQRASRWKSIIIDRECRDPSSVFEEIVETYLKPDIDFIAQMIGRIVEKPPESHAVRFAAIGLIGLLAIHSSYDHFIEAVAPGLRKVFHKKDWLVRHIVRMVLDAAMDQDVE